MSYVENLESNPATRLHDDPEHAQPGWQRSGRLWSSLKDVCDLFRIESPPSRLSDQLLFQHVQVKAGQRVFALGQGFESLFILSLGFVKTVLIDVAGNEQVLSFPMKGDLLSLDGLETGRYSSEAVALSDCDVISVPFRALLSLARKNTAIEELIYNLLSRELVDNHRMVTMLAALSAQQRVASFLLSLADRYAMMGYSSTKFMLRMSRKDIGNYLGVTLETVTRNLSAFKEIGLIGVDQRLIHIKDKKALSYYAAGHRGSRKCERRNKHSPTRQLKGF